VQVRRFNCSNISFNLDKKLFDEVFTKILSLTPTTTKKENVNFSTCAAFGNFLVELTRVTMIL